MRLRKAVESLWEISPLTVPSATAKTTRKGLSGLVNTGFAERVFSRVPCSRFVTYAPQKMTVPIRLTIDRFGGRCTLTHPDRICGLNQPRRLRMALQAHLVELERKHKTLENELHEALIHLSTDDLQIAELKRRKLMVKDQIERLKHSADTLH
jgi:hypothetical protein